MRLSQQSDRSIAAQREAIRNYCNHTELTLTDVFDEGEGASGYDTDRAAYTRMGNYLDDHDVDAVAVRDLSWLLCDRKERMRLLLDLDAAGMALHSVERGEAVDLDEDWPFVPQSICATADDVHKCTEIKRSKQETQRRMEAGYYQGRPWSGRASTQLGRCLGPDEWPTIMEAFGLLDAEVSYRAINEETGLSLATLSRLADRGRDYYYDLVDETAQAV